MLCEDYCHTAAISCRGLCPAVSGGTDNNGSVDPVNGMYKTPRGLLIVADAVSWLATRSGGPGGQHANTSDTAVTITVDIDRAGLSAPVRDRIVAAAGPVISASSAGSRSQFRNRATAWAALVERLDEAAKPPPAARRATRPSASAVRKRLAAKRHVAERKLGRRRPSVEE
ncbi:MAG: ribosome-associated protein [Ilumatobacteraceae bacterium]